jgi:selenocysteine lyase/cysteine desulfurase
MLLNIENIGPTKVGVILYSTNNIEVRSGHPCAQVYTKKVPREVKWVVTVSTYFFNIERDMTMFADAVKDIVDTMVS